MTCLIYYTTKYLITNGILAEGVLLKLNNLLNSSSLNFTVASKGKILEQLIGNLLLFVWFAFTSYVKNHVFG